STLDQGTGAGHPTRHAQVGGWRSRPGSTWRWSTFWAPRVYGSAKRLNFVGVMSISPDCGSG
ncbi:MAG: hypothetical protein WA622_19390, partial [Mycobacterium sp.]